MGVPGCGFFVLQWNPLFVFVFDILFPLWSNHSLACDHLTRPWSRSFSSLSIIQTVYSAFPRNKIKQIKKKYILYILSMTRVTP